MLAIWNVVEAVSDLCLSVCPSYGQPVSDDISIDHLVTLTLLWDGAVVFHKLILVFHLFCPVKHILILGSRKTEKEIFIHVFVNYPIKMR